MTESVTTVHVVRHGEVFNPDKILYGTRSGFPLSEAGEQMAVIAAKFLADRPVTYVVSSPLTRAQQTAEPIASAFGLPIAADERLIEAGNTFEGQRIRGPGDLLANPAMWLKLWNPFRPSWGEPYRQIAARVRAAVLDAREQAGDGDAVCVSHQLPIVCLRRASEGLHLWHDPRRRQCSLASITSIKFRGDVIVGIEYHEPVGPSTI